METIHPSFFRILLAVVVGMILIAWPDAAATYIVIAVGVMFFIPGVVGLITYFRRRKKMQEVSFLLPVEGAGSALFGLLLMLIPGFFAKALLFLLGFVLMLGGIQQIVSLVVARRWTPVPWGYYIVPLLLISAGIFILSTPSGLIVIIGAGWLLYALNELLYWLRFMRLRPQQTAQPPLISDKEAEDAEIVD